MASDSKITVEVAYARSDEQVILELKVEPQATVEEIIRRSGILERFPEIDLASNKVGIFGKPVKLEASARDRDRIEIYRPLIADPKEVRRRRAAEGKRMKKGGGSLEPGAEQG
jgi:putative ubiquitin-RnfH superfamily antitoxin RatB of RatAB toxin-antitoxin module